MPRGGRGGRGRRVNASVRAYVRSHDRNIVHGHKLALPADPPSLTLNPRYPLVLTFKGSAPRLALKVSDVLSAVIQRFSINPTSAAGLSVSITSVKVWSLKPRSVLTLTVHPVIGWDGTRQFLDAGNSILGARVGFQWARDEWNQSIPESGKANAICEVLCTDDITVHLHCVWVMPWKDVKNRDITLNASQVALQDLTDTLSGLVIHLSD